MRVRLPDVRGGAAPITARSDPATTGNEGSAKVAGEFAPG